MKEVNVTELRNHLPAYLGKVMEGEEVVITSRGKIVARLVPPVNARLQAQDYLIQLRKRCRIGDVVSPIDEPWEADDGNP